MPIEPGRSRYDFGVVTDAGSDDIVGLGDDLSPGTVLQAYRSGLFPMGLGAGGSGPIGWFSPDPRGVLELGDLRVTRSLRASCRRYRTSVDVAFAAVVAGCADPTRPDGWITPEIVEAYRALHRLGWAHSIEVWDGADLVGGLYGVAVGGLFAGESMFHRSRDASKVALVALVDLLSDGADRLIDVQWRTDHLATLGISEIPRADYLSRLEQVLRSPLPRRWQ